MAPYGWGFHLHIFTACATFATFATFAIFATSMCRVGCTAIVILLRCCAINRCPSHTTTITDIPFTSILFFFIFIFIFIFIAIVIIFIRQHSDSSPMHTAITNAAATTKALAQRHACVHCSCSCARFQDAALLLLLILLLLLLLLISSIIIIIAIAVALMNSRACVHCGIVPFGFCSLALASQLGIRLADAGDVVVCLFRLCFRPVGKQRQPNVVRRGWRGWGKRRKREDGGESKGWVKCCKYQ